MERASSLSWCESVRMYVINARCSPFTGRPVKLAVREYIKSAGNYHIHIHIDIDIYT